MPRITGWDRVKTGKWFGVTRYRNRSTGEIVEISLDEGLPNPSWSVESDTKKKHNIKSFEKAKQEAIKYMKRKKSNKKRKSAKKTKRK